MLQVAADNRSLEHAIQRWCAKTISRSLKQLFFLGQGGSCLFRLLNRWYGCLSFLFYLGSNERMQKMLGVSNGIATIKIVIAKKNKIKIHKIWSERHKMVKFVLRCQSGRSGRTMTLLLFPNFIQGQLCNNSLSTPMVLDIGDIQKN